MAQIALLFFDLSLCISAVCKCRSSWPFVCIKKFVQRNDSEQKYIMKLIRYNTPQATRASNCAAAFDVSAPGFSRLGSLFEDIFGETERRTTVAMDLYEDAHQYHACFELPGVKKSGIDVELEGGVLTIRSAQAKGGDEPKCGPSFNRSVPLPEGVALSKISAAHEDGILTVTLPKEEAPKPRQVEVK
jgi:HSP20 family protein